MNQLQNTSYVSTNKELEEDGHKGILELKEMTATSFDYDDEDNNEDDDDDVCNHDSEYTTPSSVNNTNWKSDLAGVAGNVLEWYDFACFGYFSDLIAVNFFPANQDNKLTLSFVIFGAAFLARPLGGAIIGKLGDTDVISEETGERIGDGRARAVKVAIILMAMPTFALGCLPTFGSIGWAATVLLILIRLLQGFSAGGQLVSSVVYTIERAPMEQWGVRGASVFTASSLGVTLGSFMSYLMRKILSDDELLKFGWRIPFWFALFGIIPSFYLENKKTSSTLSSSANMATASERRGDESEERDATKIIPSTTDVGDSSRPQETILSRSNVRGLVACTLVPCMSAALYYIVYIWLATYMETIREPPTPHAFGINTATGLFSLPLTMVGGWCVDTINMYSSKYCKYNAYKCVMYISLIGSAVLAPLILHALSMYPYGDSVFIVFLFQSICGALLALYTGAMLPFMIIIFPHRIRLTSVALGYNIALSICGGFSPALATYLVDSGHGTASVGLIVTVLAVLSGIGVYLGPTERYKEEEEAEFEHNNEAEII